MAIKADPKAKLDASDVLWSALLNVDRPTKEEAKWGASLQRISNFDLQWTKEHTYERWSDYGTLYGFTTHSGIMAAPPEVEPPIWQNFWRMYFDQSLLLYHLRQATLRISGKVADLAATMRAETIPTFTSQTGHLAKAEALSLEFSKCRSDLAGLVCLYEFPKLSGQQQGVELYTLQRRHLDLDAYFEEMRREIESVESFMRSRWQEEISARTERLTMLAGFFAAAGLIVACVSVVRDHWSAESDNRTWLTAVVRLTILVILFLLAAGLLRFRHWTKLFTNRLRKHRSMNAHSNHKALADWLFRIEAIDLRLFAYGNWDLSANRGGSAALLFGIPRLLIDESSDSNAPCIRPGILSGATASHSRVLASGGSSLTFMLYAAERASAEKVKANIEMALGKAPLLMHARILVEMEMLSTLPTDGPPPVNQQTDQLPQGHTGPNLQPTPAPREYRDLLRELRTRIRLRQLSEPNISPSRDKLSAHPGTSDSMTCTIDRTSPAITRRPKDDAPLGPQAGESVSKGREMRDSLYATVLPSDPQQQRILAVTQRFDQIVQSPAPAGIDHPGGDEVFRSALGRLSGKLAIIYLDGNSFGTIAGAYERSMDGHSQIDRSLHACRESLMAGLLESYAHWQGLNPSAVVCRSRGSDLTRLETTLWGGDEVRWVVPAWLALPLVATFAASVREFKAPPHPQEARGGPPLTYSMSLCLCHYKAHIHRIHDIGASLADSVKEHPQVGMLVDEIRNWAKSSTAEDMSWTSSRSAEETQKANRFAYHVFESFDHVGANLEKARRLLYGPAADDLTICSHSLAGIASNFYLLASLLPRRQVRRLAEVGIGALRTGSAAGFEYWSDLRNSLARDLEPTEHVSSPQRTLVALESGFQDGPTQGSNDVQMHIKAWIHLEVLWDYLAGAIGALGSPTNWLPRSATTATPKVSPGF
jgi:hypothetical protein